MLPPLMLLERLSNRRQWGGDTYVLSKRTCRHGLIPESFIVVWCSHGVLGLRLGIKTPCFDVFRCKWAATFTFNKWCLRRLGFMIVNDQAVIFKPSTNILGQSQYRGTDQSAAVGRERGKVRKQWKDSKLQVSRHAAECRRCGRWMFDAWIHR